MVQNKTSGGAARESKDGIPASSIQRLVPGWASYPGSALNLVRSLVSRRRSLEVV